MRVRQQGEDVIEWLGSMVGILAVLACPTLMLTGVAGRRLARGRYAGQPEPVEIDR
jgi:hypothetical protein